MINGNNISYTFHYQKSFFTVQKNYILLIQKEGNNIQVTRQEKKLNKREFHLDHQELFSGRLTAEGVRNQLANIKQIVFEVTDACNLKCTYCSYGNLYDNYDKREGKYIDINKAKMLIDYVFDLLNSPINRTQGNEVMVSFYGGEPLLNMNFIQSIVAYTQQKKNTKVEFKYNMTTNGVYLKKYADFLMKYDFNLLISLDGNEDNDGHRKFHNGKSSFKTVYDNVSYIRNNYPIFFEKNISFNSVLHNLNNKQEVIMFFKQQFGKNPVLSSVNETGIRPDKLQRFQTIAKSKKTIENTSGNITEILDLNSPTNRSLQRFIFQYSGNVYRNYNNLLQKRELIRYIPTGTCYPFAKKIFMTVTGKIFPCERIGHQFALGKITETDIEIDCEEIAYKYNAYYDKLQKQCVNCYQAKNCVQCIFIINNIEKKPTCQGFTTKQSFESYLQDKITQLYQQPVLYKRVMEEIVIE